MMLGYRELQANPVRGGVVDVIAAAWWELNSAQGCGVKGWTLGVVIILAAFAAALIGG